MKVLVTHLRVGVDEEGNLLGDPETGEGLMTKRDWDALDGCRVSPKGGRTEVQLVRERDGLALARGVAVCSLLDNFSRRLGRTIAEGRARTVGWPGRRRA